MRAVEGKDQYAAAFFDYERLLFFTHSFPSKPVIATLERVLYFLLMLINTAVNGSSWRARRNAPASTPGLPVTTAASSMTLAFASSSSPHTNTSSWSNGSGVFHRDNAAMWWKEPITVASGARRCASSAALSSRVRP